MARKQKMTLLARSMYVAWTLDSDGNPIPTQIPNETDPRWEIVQGYLKGYALANQFSGHWNRELTDTELAMLADEKRVTFFDPATIEDIRLGYVNTQNEPLLPLMEITRFERREMTCTFDTLIDPYKKSISSPLWNSEYGQFPMSPKELERLIKKDLISSTIHGIWNLETKFGRSSILLLEKLD